MDETLLRLCCKEFETYPEACKANPYGSGDAAINYPLPNYTSVYSLNESMPGKHITGMIGRVEIGRLDSGRFAWVPQVTADAQLVEAVKKLIREESEKAIATIERAVRRAASEALSININRMRL